VSKTCQSQESIEIEKNDEGVKDLTQTIKGKVEEIMKHKLLNKEKPDNYPAAALSQ
jgi:hypothetical protein